MAEAAQECLDDEEIAAYMDGGGGARRELMRSHMESCGSCRQLLVAAVRIASSEDTLAGDEEADAPKSAGRYQLLEVLGMGAMGVVYAAFDPELGRRIACKLLRVPESGGDGRAPRLAREAESLARVVHPNVVAVYDVGESGGRTFIAMELVSGGTLRDWLLRGPRGVAETLDLFQPIGEGLSAIHKAGLVHRDFKPENILLGEDGRPRVTDFGLARIEPARLSETASLETVQTLTKSGALLGTPAYMAPEQLRSQPADARSDVFAFCVVLYEALFGRRPFAGANTAELERAIVARTLQPPAQARAPEPLLKALGPLLDRGLAADPARRFASIDELLAALAAVRRQTGVRRVRRFVALGVLAALLVATGALVVGRLWARHASARRERDAAALGQTVENLRSIMRAGHLLPAHDIRIERNKVRAQLESVKAQLGELGDGSRAAGEYALGAGMLALGDAEGALAHLQNAWNAGARNPDLAYDLGLVLGLAYERAIRDLPPLAPAARQARVAELQRTLRDPAIRSLRAAEGAADASPGYVESMIAYYEKRYDDALRSAEAAFRETPMLYEAGLAAALVYAVRGSAAARGGKADEARAQFARSTAMYERVQETARSDEAVFRKAGDATIEIGSELERIGDDPRPTLEKVIGWCDRAHAIDPEADWTDEMKAFALWQLETAEFHRGIDPRPRLREAIRVAEHAITVAPKSGRAYEALGESELSLATDWQMAHGEDPSATLEKAIAAFTSCISLRPLGMAYRDRAYAYGMLARRQMAYGQDAEKTVSSTLAAIDEAVKLDPEDAIEQNDACTILADFAADRLQHGRDPEELLVRAEKRCAAAREIAKGMVREPFERADIELTRAAAARRRGADPRPAWERAARALDEALALAPKQSEVHVERALLESARAEYLSGDEAVAAIARARVAARTAVELGATEAGPSAAQAEAELAAAHVAVKSSRDPGPMVRDGLAAAGRALTIDPNHKRALEVAASLYLIVARRAHAQPLPIAAGKEMTARLLAIDPTNARALYLRAALLELAGDPSATEARAAAVAVDPKLTLP